ncbi:MAG: ATP-binding protein [Desulfosalsimonadaceae bacterium]
MKPTSISDLPPYNSRILKVFLGYIQKDFPDIDPDTVLKEAEIEGYEIEDPAHWFTQDQVDRFYDAALKLTGEPEIARKAGRFASSEALGATKQYLLGLMTPSTIYLLMEKVYPLFSRGANIRTKKIRSNVFEIIATPSPDITEKPYQCENRTGFFEAVTKLFTNHYAIIEHPECIHKGDACCRYVVSWHHSKHHFWKRLRNFFLLGSLFTCGFLFFLLPMPSWAISILAIALMASLITYNSERIENKTLLKTIENQKEAAQDHLIENNIRYNNALLILEIGQATSTIRNVDRIVETVARVMEKRLRFDRGMIMLTNKEETRLVYKDGYGHTEEQEQLLRNTEFHIDKPESKGLFVIALRKRKPFLIKNLNSIEDTFSSKSLEFARELGGESLICVPIVYEKKSLGILAVDNGRSKTDLRQSDMNLLMGVASEMAISIINARSFAKIRENEARYRLLSDNISDIIWVLDLSTQRFSFVSPSIENILGYSAEEFVRLTPKDIFTPKSLKQASRLIKEELKNEKTGSPDPSRSKTIEVNQYCKDGRSIWLEITAKFIRDNNGRPDSILGVSRDITERKLVEAEKEQLEAKLQQSQKMEAVGTLAGGIAHDFNNILSAVIGYTELGLNDASDNPKLKRKMEHVLKAGYRARDLVKQILAFSRHAEHEMRPVKAKTVISEALKLLRATIPSTIEIRHYLESDSMIFGDPTQIHQVLMNLCTNAEHAMAESGGVLEVRLKDVHFDEAWADRNPGTTPGLHLCLTVSDTGPGIPQEIMERLFEPFFTTKDPGKGTGLGLSVVHGIVRSHRGAVTVESNPGNGTVFSVYLPIVAKATQPKYENNAPVQTGSERILFVDDEKSIADLGGEMLSQLGYQVVVRTSSVDALEEFRGHPDQFDLVVTDMTMPRITGAKLAEEMLRIRPDIPIILCTGFSRSINEEDALKIGIRAFTMKPITIEQLSKTIRLVLGSEAERTKTTV